ncbi:hypothetical protein I7I50_01672 [Histoplasma capsulatum G186AR]|uniref:Uncharacterized protein n=1 Tax=Ajellomyces capsulatus TaxID=5037 RepID=A0A8H7YBL9_AJECA|nr:hypothetical protein I7I52_11888 [Histoplasma capsulatum]QSS70988.1 hypothetical protein I7I50_01672 [Histoplasma capsulatum G186AR]
MANKALWIIHYIVPLFSWLSQLSMIHHDQKSKKRDQHWMMEKPPQQKSISKHLETIQTTENREEFARIKDKVQSTIWQFATFIQNCRQWALLWSVLSMLNPELSYIIISLE